MDVSRAFQDFHFDKVSDLTKQEFSDLMNACFEEFLRSKELKDIAFSAAVQAIAGQR